MDRSWLAKFVVRVLPSPSQLAHESESLIKEVHSLMYVVSSFTQLLYSGVVMQ